MIYNVKDIDIHYHIVGEGKPVLLIHGFYPDHRLMKGCMEPVFAKRDGYKRIYIDLPGMGETKAASWMDNADDMLDTLIYFIDEVIPEAGFLLAGQSYGGLLSRGIVYKIGDRVDGVMLLCPCVIAERERRERPDHVVLVEDKDLMQSLSPHEAEMFGEEAVIQTPYNYRRFRDEVACGLEIADAAFLEAYRERGFGFSFDVDAKEVFDKPSLFLLGKQDHHVGYKDAWAILDNFPRATFAALDLAGHSLQIEQEELFHALATEWLDRCEAFDKTDPNETSTQ